jgi:hypothetical protein
LGPSPLLRYHHPMRRQLARFLPLLFLLASLLSAHPAISVVIDSKGNVYYSDTHHVFRVAPNNTKIRVVANVHTHQLWIDPQDNLYGEDLTYHDPPIEGSNWRHRIWKRSPTGQLSDHIPTRKGFLSDYHDFSFLQDRQGRKFWPNNSQIETLTKRKASQFGWTSLLPDTGHLVFSDHGSIFFHNPALPSVQPSPIRISPGRDQHSVMGVWSDQNGNTYIADWDDAAVKKFSSNPDRVTTFLRLDPPWRPTGGLATPDGTHWILEASPDNNQRLRRLSPSGQSQFP